MLEERLFEEYKELGVCWRHDDDWIAKLTAVLLPLSIAALTLPHLKEGPPNLLCAVGGSMLMAFWYFSSEICKRRFEIRFSRIHEIERVLGLDSHLRYHRESAQKLLKHQRLRRWMFVGYIVIALFVTSDMTIDVVSLPLDCGKMMSGITADTIGYIAVIFVAVIFICIWIFIENWIGSCSRINKNLRLPNDST